jgi:hypothetical protein
MGMRTTTVRLEDGELRMLESMAKLKNSSVSEELRTLVRRGLEAYAASDLDQLVEERMNSERAEVEAAANEFRKAAGRAGARATHGRVPVGAGSGASGSGTTEPRRASARIR